MLNSEDHIARPVPLPSEAGRATHGVPGMQAGADGAGRGRIANSPEHGPISVVSSDDWDEMFRAVTVRLRQTVDLPPAASAQAHTSDAAGRVRTTVLECIDALDQLHAALTQERALRLPSGPNPFDGHTAPARAFP